LLGRVGWGESKSNGLRPALFYFPSPNPLPLERAKQHVGWVERFLGNPSIMHKKQKPSLVGEGWVGRI